MKHLEKITATLLATTLVFGIYSPAFAYERTNTDIIPVAYPLGIDPVQEISPAHWMNTFNINLPTFPAGQFIVGNISVRMHPADMVRFNFLQGNNIRVGMTNNGQLSGARWASDNQGTLIPGTGDWRFIMQNMTQSTLTGVHGQYVVITAHPLIAPVQPFNRLWEQTLIETLSTEDLIVPSYSIREN